MSQVADHSSSFYQSSTLASLLDTPEQQLVYNEGKWSSVALRPLAQSSGRLTVAAQALTLAQLAGIQQALSGHLTLSNWRAHQLSDNAQHMVVVGEVTAFTQQTLHSVISDVAKQFHAEIAFQTSQPVLSQPGLLVMDMDSTVIEIECIDEIAKLAGLGEQVAAVTERAMQGELAFSESLITRVACLKGVPVSQLAQIRDGIPLMPGLLKLVKTLQSHGWKIAIASGGFTYFANYLKERLSLDAAFANTLAEESEILTGEVVGDIVDADVKAKVVQQLAEKWGISEAQTIAMGDGANDLKMMEVAGLGCAFHAKPIVNDKADVAIRFGGLDSLLYYLAAE